MHALVPALRLNHNVTRMHTALNYPSLATRRIVWLSAPAGFVLIAFLLEYIGYTFNVWFLGDERWAFPIMFICLVCFLCSSLALGHMLVAAGRAWFRVSMIAFNCLGIAAASFMFISAGAYLLT